MTNRFGKQQRVIRGSEFTTILNHGQFAADGTLVLLAKQSPGSPIARLGVTIPRRTGNAVVRNQWKRLIREAFRLQQNQIPIGFDYIVRPKKDAQPDWERIKRSVPKLANKAIRRAKLA